MNESSNATIQTGVCVQVIRQGIPRQASDDVSAYFRQPVKETGIPHQNLIDLHLRECIHMGKKPALFEAR